MTQPEKQARGLADTVKNYFATTDSFAPAYAGAALGAGALGLATAGRRAGENPRQRALRILRNAAAGGLLGGVGSQALVQGGGNFIGNIISPGLGDKEPRSWFSSPLGRLVGPSAVVGTGNVINQRMRLRSLARQLPATGLGTVPYALDPRDASRQATGANARSIGVANFPTLTAAEAADKSKVRWMVKEVDKALKAQRFENPASQDALYSSIGRRGATASGLAQGPYLEGLIRAGYDRRGAMSPSLSGEMTSSRMNLGSAGRALNYLGSGAETPLRRGIGTAGSVGFLGTALLAPEILRAIYPDSERRTLDAGKNFLTSPIPGIGNPVIKDDNWWDKLNKGL